MQEGIGAERRICPFWMHREFSTAKTTVYAVPETIGIS